MKQNFFWKKTGCAVAALILGITGICSPALAESSTGPDIIVESGLKTSAEETAPYRAWKTDTRISISRERSLIRESGMTLDAWDKETARMKKDGLSDPYTEEAFLSADPETKILRENGVVYYIGSSRAFAPVYDVMDAYRTAYRLVGMLGGSENTDLRLWSVLGIDNQTVYSFQQVSKSETVIGSTIKIAADADGRITAVFSSVDQEAAEKETLVTEKEAEQSVQEHLSNEGISGEILSGLTERTIRTESDMTMLGLEESNDDILPEQVLWVVYTANDTQDQEEYPFVAHYVQLDGTYMFSLPVEEPGSEEALQGYRKNDIFAGKTADVWTGEVTDKDGEKKTITVPVMYSESDGLWYLGDVDRRIAVVDYASAAYGEDHPLELVSSETNDGWGNQDLFMLNNYIQAMDFYADMGWNGPDGEGTDVLILKDLCTKDGTPYENAASLGRVECWQMFGYTSPDDETSSRLVEGFDVMAHEYTHTFTSTVMNTNLYENDMGAINEAMSDIMGNLAEYILQPGDDKDWLLGENTAITVRSMSDPNAFDQPEYVWDIYYGPHTDDPSDINDRGGVHFNSSLLNRIAALLCRDHGMSYEDAVDFWMMVACGLTPRTDYVQIEALLQWALKESGNEIYSDELAALIEEENLSRTSLPDSAPEGRALVSLEVPDSEAFKDENWGLFSFQFNKNALSEILSTSIKLMEQMTDETVDKNSIMETLEAIIENLKLDRSRITLETPDEEGPEGMIDPIVDVLSESVGKLLVQNNTWKVAGTDEMIMVTEDLPSLYVLMNVTDSGTKINGLAVLLNGKWYDLGGIPGIENALKGEAAPEEPAPDEEALPDDFIEHLKSAGEMLIDFVGNMIENRLFGDGEEKSAENNVVNLPTKGLEDITLIN